MNSRTNRSATLRRTALAVALSMGVAGVAFAQSTTGSIFGLAEAGETVSISGSTGITREVPVDSTGRYRVGNLPLGTYTVSLQKNGAVVNTRNNVNLTVNAGTEVSFVAAPVSAADATALSGVSVTANSLPSIDVSSVDSRTVVTSETLARLPLNRSAESIALLAPGAVSGSGQFGEGKTVSFGGAGATENAYYINGYNSTDPLRSIGGVGLPYGAIDQQEVYTGGYSAKYGRSDGGVISQVGKRGTNEWKFGAQVLWAPKFAANERNNVYYPTHALPAGYHYTNPDLPGTEYQNRDGNKEWTTTYSAYIGGPLIKDKLYLFLAAESEKTEGTSTTSADQAVIANNHYRYSSPKYYAKLDWNINDSNILELTGIQSNDERQGTYYDYNYDTHAEGDFVGYPDSTKVASKYYIGKYTSYITDDLTFTLTYGKSKTDDLQNNPGNSPFPHIVSPQNQDPLIVGDNPIVNSSPSSVVKADGAGSETHGLRLDLEYQLGDHHLAAGIDNMFFRAIDEGQSEAGPGYHWTYNKQGDPTAPINDHLGVPPAGGRGYYVTKGIFVTTTGMSVDQKAQYIEDRWQVNDKFLLSLGLRNDKFNNMNNAGDSYVDSGNQWAPRLGFSWDVFGDSTMKIFGNLGRYYLALPNSVSIRGASASTNTAEHFTYTGIDENGEPTGLHALTDGPVSTNDEFGQDTDAKTIAAHNLSSQYQDEGIIGISKAFGPSWTAGATFTVRKLQAAIDDVCDPDKVAAKFDASGGDSSTVKIPGCQIFNPGKTNDFLLANLNGGGYSTVTMTKDDWGFSEGAKRKYYGLNLFLEHPFDGKWQARLDYTFSRSYGNTEGQVKSDIGQTDVSKTQDWDAAGLMTYANGLLANNRKHQIKLYGSYEITPEWILAGSLQILSGTPKSCLGYFVDETDPIGYGSSYHYCDGQISHPGDAGNQPWTKRLDLGVSYRPAFADHKLSFGVNVFNVFNENKPLQSIYRFETNPSTLSNTYGMGNFYEDPRYVRFSATYDY
jgi:outer membrane receptor protein involved in Fe transport